ncbi:TlpA family protein disulfide reductase [Paenibacillus sacheonensis]|uniref:Redoxin domain-containing protein n=1 Tax=Paenibacillus sacheonensis TaxID=742054 RepID=A0A7X4YKA0_9BACL|nr:TlpA disulfide reductase family protein [Paenibacillus sacheonensis]MBM7563704.1 thiol-disulfide isomerase/thioredoxin [Paenibacillus sacheonensis]NBC67940.1 redoxin domain-containing protein [Paenibacillus sacheonensis]
MKRSLILLAIVLILAGAAVYQNNGKHDDALAASSDVRPKPGYTAPTLTLPDLKDQNVAIGGKQDKLTLVNFWASWCYPCEMEAPDLQALAKEYKGKLQILGINATSLDKERQAREFVDQQKLTFPILMDRKGNAQELYKVNSFPLSVLVDGNGIVRERVQGVIDKSKWQEMIDKWLDAAIEEKASGNAASKAS